MTGQDSAGIERRTRTWTDPDTGRTLQVTITRFSDMGDYDVYGVAARLPDGGQVQPGEFGRLMRQLRPPPELWQVDQEDTR